MFKKHWPIIFLIFITLFLRLYKLQELFYFTYDESVFAFVGRRLILWHHVPLIGGVTPFGVHVAPYFYWFFTLILSIGKLNPIAWGYFSALLGAITVFTLYFVTKELFNKKIGFISAVLWAFSALANIYDRHFWGLTFGPVASILVIYFLTKYIEGRKKFIIPLGITLALIIHADLSYLVFVLLAVSAWVIYKLPKKGFLIVIFFILLSLTPLLIFDLRHNFANTSPFLKYLKAEKSESRFENQTFIDRLMIFPNSLSRFIWPTFDTEISEQYSYCPAYIQKKYSEIHFFAVIIAIGGLIWFIANSIRGKRVPDQLFTILILIYFIGIQLYGVLVNGDVFEHYLTGLFPVFIIVFACFLAKLPKKIWLLFLLFILMFNFSKILKFKNSHGLEFKKQAITFAYSAVGDKDFSLESFSSCWRYSGYRYLFAAFGREPVKSYVDPNFGYLYGTTKIAANHPDDIVAIITHDFLPETVDFYNKYALYKSHEKKSALFGNIEVIIMDNTDHWF